MFGLFISVRRYSSFHGSTIATSSMGWAIVLVLVHYHGGVRHTASRTSWSTGAESPCWRRATPNLMTGSVLHISSRFTCSVLSFISRQITRS